jgi:hypothetical protein
MARRSLLFVSVLALLVFSLAATSSAAFGYSGAAAAA